MRFHWDDPDVVYNIIQGGGIEDYGWIQSGQKGCGTQKSMVLINMHGDKQRQVHVSPSPPPPPLPPLSPSPPPLPLPHFQMKHC